MAPRPERLSRGWLVGICVALLLLAASAAIGGCFFLSSRAQSEALGRQEAMALDRAKECVTATPAPDVAAKSASQAMVIQCATGEFATQADTFNSLLLEAYRAANVSVRVSEIRAAVEKRNGDGSIDLLVAVRVVVRSSQAVDREQGYRLRVHMAAVDGTYKINRLDQATS